MERKFSFPTIVEAIPPMTGLTYRLILNATLYENGILCTVNRAQGEASPRPYKQNM